MSSTRPLAAETMRSRADELLAENRDWVFRQTDRWFAGLMALQWLAGIAAAYWISPRTWAGATSAPHIHLWAAIFGGGVISGFPILLALLCPGQTITRYAIAIGQMLTSALLIHLTGGRIETHFHVFGSLAFLAAYRDWTVFVPATLVVALDHFLRGAYWPQSVYGVLAASGWRWFEHAGWVVFENVFLIASCRRSVDEMRRIAEHQVTLEATSENLRWAMENAEAANHAKSDFLAMISHEIRTPMNGIFGMTELALDTADDADRRDYLLRGRACATSLMTILNDVLDFSKIEAGRIELDSRDVDLRAVVDGVLDTLAFEADRRQLELIGFVDPRLPSILRGDAGRLRQVLINLAGNALKFTEQGEIEIRIEPSGGDVGVIRGTVRDTGIGIPHEHQAAIFDAFVQAHANDPRSHGGTGLGLAISQRLVRLMGGDIGMQSRQGAGSTFWFTARLFPVPERAGRESPSHLDGVRVLVIEPNTVAAQVIVATLASHGCLARIASDHRTAIEMARQAARGGEPFDAAVLDLTALRDGRGGVVHRVGEPLGVQTVVLTPLCAQPSAANDLHDVVTTLAKPVKERQLVAAVGIAVGRTRALHRAS